MSAPVFILVHPQMGENIGAAARVMGNFGLTDLRIIAPRDGWPSEAATTMAAGSPVLENCQVFQTIEEAVADCSILYATTARPRGMVKPVFTGRQAMADASGLIQAGESVGVLFGAERTGLPNEAVTLSRAIITLPVSKAFSSLNLGMAVGVLAHEWRASEPAPEIFERLEDRASAAELLGFYEHLERELHDAGFFYPPEKTSLMIQNLRNMFSRGDLTSQEVRTLRGVVKALAKGRGQARVE